MAWKLVEVPDDDDEVLSDWQLLGVKVALESVILKVDQDVSDSNPFAVIWVKLGMHFARAIENEHRRDREEVAP
jgi:hypothetical protein